MVQAALTTRVRDNTRKVDDALLSLTSEKLLSINAMYGYDPSRPMNRTKAIQFWHQVEGFRGDHGRVLPDSAGLVGRHALLTRDTHHEPNLLAYAHSLTVLTQPKQGRQVLVKMHQCIILEHFHESS